MSTQQGNAIPVLTIGVRTAAQTHWPAALHSPQWTVTEQENEGATLPHMNYALALLWIEDVGSDRAENWVRQLRMHLPHCYFCALLHPQHLQLGPNILDGLMAAGLDDYALQTASLEDCRLRLHCWHQRLSLARSQGLDTFDVGEITPGFALQHFPYLASHHLRQTLVQIRRQLLVVLQTPTGTPLSPLLATKLSQVLERVNVMQKMLSQLLVHHPHANPPEQLMRPPITHQDYIIIDHQLTVQQYSDGVLQYADTAFPVTVGQDIRDSFPELVGIEPILGELLTEKTKGYELSGIARLTAEDYPLYFDLYIHTYRPSSPGDRPRLIILINNATDRMLFQQQLLQTANESQLLLKRLATTKNYISQVMYSMADALIVTTQSGIIKQTNPAAQRLFGYKDYELLAQPIANLVRDPQFLNNIARGQPVDQAEVTCQRRNQKTLYVSFSCGVIVTEDDQQEFVYVGRDVTERKLAEAQIRQLNQSLRDRTQELELANEELESFSRTVSHDLRAPLGHINAFYQLLREDYATQWPAEAQDYLEQIQLASQRMERLIHDLLQLSRATRLELTRDKVDLAALAHQVMQQLRRSEPDRACTVTIAPQVWVWGNYTLLQIVMENLLRNAWKYTSKRAMAEIEFGVSQAVTLNHALATSGRVFWVRDNGAGFNMAYADKLFQTFSRLHSPREFEGTGIGLATVQRIIHRHGGQIWAEAVEDQGATFYFTLDANSPELHTADSHL